MPPPTGSSASSTTQGTSSGDGASGNSAPPQVHFPPSQVDLHHESPSGRSARLPLVTSPSPLNPSAPPSAATVQPERPRKRSTSTSMLTGILYARRHSAQFDSVPVPAPTTPQTLPPNAVVQNNRRASMATSNHPWHRSEASHGTDLESAGGAERPSGNASAFSGLEGRSYRFQNYDFSGTSGSPLSRSYTASSNTIRDSTARLASMALQSDDEDYVSSRIGPSLDASRIEEISEERPEDNVDDASSTRIGMGNPAAKRASPPGPSNLTKALNDQQTLEPERGRSSTSPSAEAARNASSSHDSSSRSQSRSTRRPAAVKNRRSEDRSMGDSVISTITSTDEVERDRERAGRSAFGYGALAEAEHEQEEAERQWSESGKNKKKRRQRTDSLDGAEADDEGGRGFASDFSTGVIDEHTPLLSSRLGRSRGAALLAHAKASLNPAATVRDLSSYVRKLTWTDIGHAATEPVRLLPAVILGTLLNVLDGVSYGMITFPSAYPIFASFGGDGVSMFFMTCIISQVIYSTMSIFKGGNGSMMIEVVPFFHILVNIIIDEIGEDQPHAVIATTLVAFALSSVLTGITFMAMGWFRLGSLIGFFPRHLLVGCIGGVGIFLIETGLEVTSRLQSEAGFQYNLETMRYLFSSPHMVVLWLLPLLLAVFLRVLTAHFRNPLLFPAYFLVIPIVFYAVGPGILRIPLQDLRSDGWMFDIGQDAGDAPFWRFYTYFDFSQTSLRALWATMPTQLALVFFGILHVPLNVPALGISIGEDNVVTDRELVAHGWSNIIAGLLGSVPNYLCYVNSVLFYRVGGGSRLSGFMLAGATFIVMLAGPGTISYLPVMLVGALIYVLGLDLAKEALYDTIGQVNGYEYVTILLICFTMTYFDFVAGILAGLILACFFFVVQTSRRKTVRAIFDGSIARSTVRRHKTQRQFLESVGTQTQILKLQGFLFFGTINSVENLVRRGLDIAAWRHNPIRFLIFDFSLVSGVDFSAAEAFQRLYRLLAAKGVVLVFCGLAPNDDVAIALQSVDMWTDRGIRVEVFASLNEALEWTENEYLRGFYASGGPTARAFGKAALSAGGGLDVPGNAGRQPAFVLNESFENSPRRHHLQEAAKVAVRNGHAHGVGAGGSGFSQSDSVDLAPSGDEQKVAAQRQSSNAQHHSQPLMLLMITFRAYASPSMDEAFFASLVKYFTAVRLAQGEVLWQRGDEPDGLYLIESGILKARYEFPQEDFEINEAMLAGTIAGELTFLSKQPRNTTVHAALDSVLWRLDSKALAQLEADSPDTFGEFIKGLLRVTGEEQECLLSYLVSRLS